MVEFDNAKIKSVEVGDTVFKVWTENDEKKLKGYQYDSLVFRYIIARKQMAEYERLKFKGGCSPKENDFYDKQANRDIMRFCQILNEAIGEHN